MSESTDVFCWVKAVLRNLPAENGTCASADSQHFFDHPLLQSLRMQKEGRALEALQPPPVPEALAKGVVGAFGGLGTLGGKVDPPPSPNEIPKVPSPPGAAVAAKVQAEDSAASASPGYWQHVAYAPGIAAGDAFVVLLEFRPVAGPRERAVLWREAHPEWFSDAASVVLLNHGY